MQATTTTIHLIYAIDLSAYLDLVLTPASPNSEFPSFFFPGGLPNKPFSLLDIGLVQKESALLDSVQIMVLWGVEGIAGSDWLELCVLTSINKKTIYRLETCGVDGTIQGWLLLCGYFLNEILLSPISPSNCVHCTKRRPIRCLARNLPMAVCRLLDVSSLLSDARFVSGSILVPSELEKRSNPHYSGAFRTFVDVAVVAVATNRSIELRSTNDLSCLHRVSRPTPHQLQGQDPYDVKSGETLIDGIPTVNSPMGVGNRPIFYYSGCQLVLKEPLRKI